MNEKQLSVEEAMAVAVLQGDQLAAVALADLVHEKYAGSTLIPPIHKITASMDRIRAVVYVKDNVEFNYADLNSIIVSWLNGVTITLTIIGVDKVQLFELPDNRTHS